MFFHVWILWAFGAAAASLPEPHGIAPLKPIPQAPEAIRRAAQSIVRIQTEDGGSGTAFFLKETRWLVTNAHVLGPQNCSREGCYASIDLKFEHGGKHEKESLFLVPVLHRANLDLAVYEAYLPSKNSPIGERYAGVPGLAIAPAQAESSATLYIVGHPFAGVKRWSESKIFTRQGDWCASGHCIAPGSSGSPVLDEKGDIQGLVHRSTDMGNELLALNQARHIAFFSMVNAFRDFLASPREKPAADGLDSFIKISLAGELTVDSEAEDLGLTQFPIQAMITRRLWRLRVVEKGQPDMEMSLMAMLAEACQEEVDDPANAADPDASYHVCQMGMALLDCQGKYTGTEADRCPKRARRKQWEKNFNRIADLVEKANGEGALHWRIAAATLGARSQKTALGAARKVIEAAVAQHRDSQLFHLDSVATYSVAREQMKIGEHDFLSLLMDYDRAPHAGYFAEHVVEAAVALGSHRTFLRREELHALYSKILSDPQIPVTLKIDLETNAMEEGWLRAEPLK